MGGGGVTTCAPNTDFGVCVSVCVYAHAEVRCACLCVYAFWQWWLGGGAWGGAAAAAVVAAAASKGLNKDHSIFMHLLLLTDEKCQLSCFYFGVFALFIWFISAWVLLALTAARPVLLAPEFFRLI